MEVHVAVHFMALHTGTYSTTQVADDGSSANDGPIDMEQSSGCGFEHLQQQHSASEPNRGTNSDTGTSAKRVSPPLTSVLHMAQLTCTQRFALKLSSRPQRAGSPSPMPPQRTQTRRSSSNDVPSPTPIFGDSASS